MDIDEHLCGYDEVLDFFGFGDWHLVIRRASARPELEDRLRRLPRLLPPAVPAPEHASAPTSATSRSTTTWGPHQRMTSPDPALLALQDVPEDEWNLDRICGGVWTIFPHVSIAGGNGGGLISQLFPGPTPGDSVTIQNYYVAAEPSDERRQEAARRGRLPRTSRPRRGLLHRPAAPAGAGHRAKEFVIFGRNEGGGQRFHTLLDEYLADHPVAVR